MQLVEWMKWEKKDSQKDDMPAGFPAIRQSNIQTKLAYNRQYQQDSSTESYQPDFMITTTSCTQPLRTTVRRVLTHSATQNKSCRYEILSLMAHLEASGSINMPTSQGPSKDQGDLQDYFSNTAIEIEKMLCSCVEKSPFCSFRQLKKETKS